MAGTTTANTVQSQSYITKVGNENGQRKEDRCGACAWYRNEHKHLNRENVKASVPAHARCTKLVQVWSRSTR
jgi:hypothetical protein